MAPFYIMVKIKLLRRTYVDRVGTCEADQEVPCALKTARYLVEVAKYAEWVGHAPKKDALDKAQAEDKSKS